MLIGNDKNVWLKKIWDDRGLINGNKLRTYRQFKTSLTTSQYVINLSNREQRSLLAKFRCGTLPLEIELGRFSKPKTPLSDRICKHCNTNNIEDEVHFLTICNLYADLRDYVWDHASSVNPNFSLMTPFSPHRA